MITPTYSSLSPFFPSPRKRGEGMRCSAWRLRQQHLGDGALAPRAFHGGAHGAAHGLAYQFAVPAPFAGNAGDGALHRLAHDVDHLATPGVGGRHAVEGDFGVRD